MSSTICQTELQAVSKEEVTDLQSKPTKEDHVSQTKSSIKQRPHQLVRSSSVDKIIKFNAYICSQNYYILPSLLMWLKTSQSALSNQTEKSIMFIKSAFYAASMYKMLEQRFKVVFPTSSAQWLHMYGTCLRAVREFFFVTLPQAWEELVEFINERFVVLAIYAALTIIALQFFSCVLIVCSVFVPNGFIFMVVCMYVMGHIAATAMFHHIKQEEKKDKEGSKNSRRVKRLVKPVLGDRTISKFDLF